MLLSLVVQLSREESQIIKRASNHIGIINPTEDEAKTVGGVLDAGNLIREEHIVRAIVTFEHLLRKCKEDQLMEPDPEWIKRNIKALEEGKVTLVKDPVEAVGVIKESRATQEKHVQEALDLLHKVGGAMNGDFDLV
jgi:hypothetical protein